MDLIVEAKSSETRGIARLGNRTFPCALGRAGLIANKREGDGGTPIGCFAFRRLLYRADRVPHIATRLPARHVEPEDGWCDDPADSAYNKPVRLPRPTRHETILPHPARHERLWRDDHLYDLVVVIGHNDDPVVKGAGSAVFVHVAHEAWSPTGGCIAFRREDLLWILARVTTNDAVVTGSQKTEIRSQSSE